MCDPVILVLYEEVVKPAFPQAEFNVEQEIIWLRKNIFIWIDKRGYLTAEAPGAETKKFDLSRGDAFPELLRYLRWLSKHDM